MNTTHTRHDHLGARRLLPTLALGAAAMLWVACADEQQVDVPQDTGSDTAQPDATEDVAPDAAPDVEPGPDPSTVAIVPPANRIRRLTSTQYRNAIGDLFGTDVVIPPALEPDPELAGLLSVGASAASVSQRGVEQYEDAAFAIAQQVLGDTARRAAAVPCTPAGTVDDTCAATYLTALTRRAWREPADSEAIARLVQVAAVAADTQGDFYTGLTFATAAVLQSPRFLYRFEIGTPSPDNASVHLLDDWELASRLSFFLWNTIPDETLLAAAESGALNTPQGLATEVDRLLADPRARRGIRTFFTELYHLYALDRMAKDATLFVHFSPDLGPSAREETLGTIEHHVFDLDADYRDLMTTRTTWINRKLASLYNVRAPSREGFGLAELPDDGSRRGLLGHVSTLSLHSHPVSSSATLRGRFVREVLLCNTVEPPPVDVNTALPEPSGTTRTLRERVAEHLTEESCAGCHNQMDPIGLGLENFDAVGRWRQLDNGAEIDPSGVLDGVAFTDAWEMGAVLRDHPDLPRCLVRNLYRYALGRENAVGDRAQLQALQGAFASEGYRVQALIRSVALSAAFRVAGTPAELAEPE